MLVTKGRIFRLNLLNLIIAMMVSAPGDGIGNETEIAISTTSYGAELIRSTGHPPIKLKPSIALLIYVPVEGQQLQLQLCHELFLGGAEVECVVNFSVEDGSADDLFGELPNLIKWDISRQVTSVAFNLRPSSRRERFLFSVSDNSGASESFTVTLVDESLPEALISPKLMSIPKSLEEILNEELQDSLSYDGSRCIIGLGVSSTWPSAKTLRRCDPAVSLLWDKLSSYEDQPTFLEFSKALVKVAIWQVKPEDSSKFVPLLLKALEPSIASDEVRRAVLRSLDKFQDSRILPALASFLAAPANSGSTHTSRYLAAKVLVEARKRQGLIAADLTDAEDVISDELFTSTTEFERNQAAALLAEIGTRSALMTLRHALFSTDQVLRAAAAYGLRNSDDSSVVTDLYEFIKTPPFSKVHEVAIRSLGKTSNLRTVSSIADLLEVEHIENRKLILRSLDEALVENSAR